MSATICGHDRETLRFLCGINDLALRMNASVDPLHKPTRAQSTAAAMLDPAKLAAIIAELIHAFGMSAGINGRERDDVSITYWPNEYHPNDAPGIRVRAGLNARYWFGKELTMPQARTFALRLLDATTATAQDIERIIGEL